MHKPQWLEGLFLTHGMCQLWLCSMCVHFRIQAEEAAPLRTLIVVAEEKECNGTVQWHLSFCLDGQLHLTFHWPKQTAWLNPMLTK